MSHRCIHRLKIALRYVLTKNEYAEPEIQYSSQKLNEYVSKSVRKCVLILERQKCKKSQWFVFVLKKDNKYI